MVCRGRTRVRDPSSNWRLDGITRGASGGLARDAIRTRPHQPPQARLDLGVRRAVAAAAARQIVRRVLRARDVHELEAELGAERRAQLAQALVDVPRMRVEAAGERRAEGSDISSPATRRGQS